MWSHKKSTQTRWSIYARLGCREWWEGGKSFLKCLLPAWSESEEERLCMHVMLFPSDTVTQHSSFVHNEITVKTYGDGERCVQEVEAGCRLSWVLKLHNPCNCKRHSTGLLTKERNVKGKKVKKQKCSRILRERKESSDCLLGVWGSNDFQMCGMSFVFSKEYKTFPLRGIQTTAGIHRLKIHNRG